jgi:hypothetical protein
MGMPAFGGGGGNAAATFWKPIYRKSIDLLEIIEGDWKKSYDLLGGISFKRLKKPALEVRPVEINTSQHAMSTS